MRPQLGEMGSLSGGRDSALNTKLWQDKSAGMRWGDSRTWQILRTEMNLG